MVTVSCAVVWEVTVAADTANFTVVVPMKFAPVMVTDCLQRRPVGSCVS